MILVFGHDALVMKWVKKRTPWVADFGPSRAIGLYRDGKALGGVVYYNYRDRSIDVAIASDDPRWCRKGVLAGLFHYPFVQLACRRMTAIIPARNERSLKLCLGLGFQREGLAREAFDDDDAIICGMLRRECRWLRGKHDLHG